MDAQTGNTMIPSHPGIAAQQASEGAAQVAPPSAGAPPTVGVVPAPELDAGDFWSGVEQRIAPTVTPEPAIVPEVPGVPQAIPAAAPPTVAPVPSPGQPQAPASVAAPQVAAPVQPMVLTPEQQAVLTEAAGQQAAPVVPAPQAAPTDLAALEAQTIDHLARTEYAIPEDVATELVSNPEKVYPTLAARLHVRLATQLGQAVQQMLPTVIDQMVGQKLASYKLENEFFIKYPQLNDPRFRPVVLSSLTMARNANPQANAEQVMNDGATLAAMKLRLSLPGQQAVVPVAPAPQVNGQMGQQIPAAAPVYPAAPVAAALAPFQPALGGGGNLPTQPQGNVNEFELLALDQNW